MTYAEMTLPEYDQEMATTRRVLERVPEDKLDWRMNAKSNTIGWNANHLVEIPGWVENVLTESFFDFNPQGGEPYATPTLASRQALLDDFDRNVAAGRKALAALRDESLGDTWSLLNGGETVISMPRAAVFRAFILSHMIHHRAILTAYYRLLDVPVPAIYGPSADEQG